LWLGEDISKLFTGSYMRNDDIPLDSLISQEMVLDVYVFGSIMLTMVVSNLDGTLIVTQEGNLVHSVTIVL
jgi:hypothetical protein